MKTITFDTRTTVLDTAFYERAAEALEYMAHNEAGQTQEPHLLAKTDFLEWHDAQAIRAALKSKVLP